MNFVLFEDFVGGSLLSLFLFFFKYTGLICQFWNGLMLRYVQANNHAF